MKMLYSLVLSISLLLSSFSIDFSQLSQVLFNNEEVTAVYYDDRLVWANGALVTYVVNGVEHKEWVAKGETVLTPRTFTPETTTGTFCGWTDNKQNNIAVETLIAGQEPITLYALSRIDIVKDCVVDDTYVTNTTLADCPVHDWYNEAHYFGFWKNCSGASTGFSSTGTLVLDDALLNCRIYYDTTYMLRNGIFNGNNSWWGRVTNNGVNVVNYSNANPPSNYYYTTDGSFVLEDTTIQLSVGVSRGYNESQNTQQFSSGIGFTNLYVVGVFE